MTQPDKDREAFEMWGSTVGYPSERISKHRHHSKPDEYQHTATQEKWLAWQAARAHYALKLSREEAMRALYEFHRKAAADDSGIEVEELLTFEQSRDSADEDEHTPYLNAAENIEALRAAGVQFKEDVTFTKIEWYGSNGRKYARDVKAGREAEEYRKILDETIRHYERLLQKYAPDCTQKHKAEIERVVHERNVRRAANAPLDDDAT